MGFDGFFFARADYQDKQQRVMDRSFDFIWRASPSLGSAQQVIKYCVQLVVK